MCASHCASRRKVAPLSPSSPPSSASMAVRLLRETPGEGSTRSSGSGQPDKYLRRTGGVAHGHERQGRLDQHVRHEGRAFAFRLSPGSFVETMRQESTCELEARKRSGGPPFPDRKANVAKGYTATALLTCCGGSDGDPPQQERGPRRSPAPCPWSLARVRRSLLRARPSARVFPQPRRRCRMPTSSRRAGSDA